MAIHNSTHSLVEEALTEYLAIAEHCITTGKPTGGCYGFPTALLLFSIVDAIGSFYRGNNSFTIAVDQKKRTINGTGFQHYFVLNSEYYSQALTEKDIQRLYDYYRCLLVHNAALAPAHFLDIGHPTDPLFAKRPGSSHIDYVNLRPFLDLSHSAVAKFLKVAPTLVPISKQGKGITHKR
jgi:hypothetical protein